MMWIPVNKKTGVEYPPITDAHKAEAESYYMTKGKYEYKPAPDQQPKPERVNTTATKRTGKTEAVNTTAPEPVEARRIEDPETGEQ